MRISRWSIYIPRNLVEVNGLNVPAPSDDEDSVTLAYEASSRLLNGVGGNAISNVVVVGDDIDYIKLNVLLSLLDLENINAHLSQDLVAALTLISKMPKDEVSMLIVTNSSPPAGCVAVVFNDVHAQASITLLKTLSENVTFTKPLSTKLDTFIELIHEMLLSRKVPKLLTEMLQKASLEPSKISFLAGSAPKLHYLVKVSSSIGLPPSSLAILTKLSSTGINGRLLALISLLTAIESASKGDKILFIVLEESGLLLSSIIEKI